MTSEVIEILHVDRHLVVVNKPPGIDVHGRSQKDATSLVAAVARQLKVEPRRLHPASRLDRPVSGVVPIVRSKLGRRSLTQQYQRREVSRRYVALVSGIPSPRKGHWDRPIGKDQRDPRKRVIDGREGRKAVTAYQVTWSAADQWSLVELAPKTGRTHQLRVHLSQLATCPIAGDRRYGGPGVIDLPDGTVIAVPRVMLHARQITLRHPETDAPLVFEAEIWPDFREILEALNKN